MILTDLPSAILSFIGSQFRIAHVPLILVTGGLPAEFKEHSESVLAQVRRVQRWWEKRKLPANFDASWCFTDDSEWSCKAAEKIYKRFMYARFPVELLYQHSNQLAWKIHNDDHTEAWIFEVWDEDVDDNAPELYLLGDGNACCIDGSLSSWKMILELANARNLRELGV